nr:protein FAR1-RELATED SEQUENCE 5-like [Ipomoea batatas]
MEESADVPNYWMTTCDPSLKPVVGQRFESLENGIKFYIKYASAAGFDVRRSTEIKNKYGVTIKKYLVCSREGYKEAKDTDLMESGAPTHPKRRRTSNRVGCIAKIIFRLNTFYKCLGLANGRVEKLQQIAHALEGVETSMSGDKDSGLANLGKRATMETYCGIPAPETIIVHPPQVSKNKGSGKRIKSMKEIAIKGMIKKGRTCATCGLANRHNSRTCLKR